MTKTPEQMAEELATEYAEFATISEHTYKIAYLSYLGGYSMAHEKIQAHIQFLELQLREANTRAMRLEAQR